MLKTKTQLTGMTPGAEIAVTCNDILVFDAEIPQVGEIKEDAVLAEWLVDDATEWTTNERGRAMPLKGTPVRITLVVKSGRLWFCSVRSQIMQPLYTFENTAWRQDVFVPDSDEVALQDLRYRDDDWYLARYGLTKSDVLPWIVVLEITDQRTEPLPEINGSVELRDPDGSVVELSDGWICIMSGQTLIVNTVLHPVDPWELVLPS